MREEETNTSMIRDAWDEYHASYMEFNLMERPDFHRFFADGGVMLDDLSIELAGEVTGKRLLDICCAGDAKQAFSWENLGADVIACDISPIAIQIARKNADKIGSKVEFHVADAQELQPPRLKMIAQDMAHHCDVRDEGRRGDRPGDRPNAVKSSLPKPGPVVTMHGDAQMTEDSQMHSLRNP